MDFLNWVLLAISTIAGATTLISLFMFKEQKKRFQTAEAFEKEVNALKLTVKALQEQVDFQNEQIKSTQALVTEKDVYIGILSADKHVIEVKHAKNKSAINKAYECEYCPEVQDCPVLKQRRLNEETYREQIEQRKV